MAVDHKNITGVELHEPKGVAAASASQVYVSNGAGSGTWSHLPHGNLYYSNIGTGTTYTTPTAYTVINMTTISPTTPHEFTHSGTGRLTYTGTGLDVTANVNLTIKHSAGAGVDCFFAVHKNGTLVPGGEMVQTADSANYNNISLSAHLLMATNDYLEVFLKCASGNIIVHAISVDTDGRL